MINSNILQQIRMRILPPCFQCPRFYSTISLVVIQLQMHGPPEEFIPVQQTIAHLSISFSHLARMKDHVVPRTIHPNFLKLAIVFSKQVLQVYNARCPHISISRRQEDIRFVIQLKSDGHILNDATGTFSGAIGHWMHGECDGYLSVRDRIVT